ncbi:hypothetical protein ABZS66_46500, partial [Dactylosporangium sp. NPDC005572]|uniref:hypothetical protein n=1 Tax=Dactylosporangium sp. NPDC005572 TaxID=3156889 RepID=UPI0033B714A7
ADAAAEFAAGGPAPRFVTGTRAELGLPADAEAGTEAGTPAGPLTVLAVRPATRDSVSRRLFAGWLEERRAAARVEWNWGPA